MLFRRMDADFHRAAALYNADIKQFEDQQLQVPPAALDSLAQLFVQHGVHKDYGLTLLHRHHDLSPTSVMVHRRLDADTELCEPAELGQHELDPCLFYCKDGREFLPFEYDIKSASNHQSMTKPPGQAFLTSLADFLRSESLDTVLGLSRIGSPDEQWIETTTGLEKKETVSRRSKEDIMGPGRIVTGWAFVEDGAGVTSRAQIVCEVLDDGTHACIQVPDWG